VHAEVLPWTICLPTLLLIAQAVYLLERGQTDRQTNRQTDATERPMYPTPAAIQPAWVIIFTVNLKRVFSKQMTTSIRGGPLLVKTLLNFLITLPPVEMRSIVIRVFVCLSVCPLTYLKNVSKLHGSLSTCYLWTCIGPRLATVQYAMYFRFCGWLMFSHNGAREAESKTTLCLV